MQNARYLAEHLLPHGWDTVVVDIQWYEPDPGTADYQEVSAPELDAWGRPQPAVGRFPSSAGGRGFADLAARIHAMGLRFGVHLMRGVPRRAAEERLPVLGSDATCADIADPANPCPWNPDDFGVDMTRPGAQEYYDSVLAMLAGWGVDYLKLDDVLYPPIQAAEITAVSRAIAASGRPMTLSLSPGKQLSLENLDLLRETAQLWRISDDFWDDWAHLREQFQRAARWAPHQRPGGWADADMLPLGRIGIRAHVGDDRRSRFTPAEQRTLVSLWCLLRSPLMFGGHLPDTDPATLALLTNDDVLELLGSDASREIVRDGDLVVWAAERGSTRWRAVFQLGDAPRSVTAHLADLGCPDATRAVDVWTGEELAVVDGGIPLEVEAHGVRLLRLA
ncbi:glycoside hydrolase family 27 protein [Clavibacter zhangzhiyongii]|uniref:Alpha-galactosidase n=2 Tax=Clavibacter zhangzhiyongii TaxID=2768071 RepID=A0A7L7Z5T8_9MICO|nr:glycoside hydrolase family 27 protein [Clavibacter zhangzhiyongii]